MCSKVLFNFGAAATTMREWEIKVTQFACGDEMGVSTTPPPLQWFSPQVSFGLSVSYTGKARGEWDQKCSEDYLEIPGAVHVTMMIPLKIGPISATTNVRSRACGRFLNLADAGADRQNSMASVCTQMKPFRVTFVTNGDEVTTAPDGTRAAKTGDPRVNEQGLFPGGIMGFSLDYRQVNC
eukprot:maker-scaffold539_size142544-snap-gene-0.26 protein:Tk01718 transcript:maker-scaffold539_size142544-snap-gene-0.26-mRNA-1 annotation:"hypothetical protein DAPPUDRAFT_240461"